MGSWGYAKQIDFSRIAPQGGKRLKQVCYGPSYAPSGRFALNMYVACQYSLSIRNLFYAEPPRHLAISHKLP